MSPDALASALDAGPAAAGVVVPGPFDPSLRSIPGEPADLWGMWRTARERFDRTGLWPVLTDAAFLEELTDLTPEREEQTGKLAMILAEADGFSEAAHRAAAEADGAEFLARLRANGQQDLADLIEQSEDGTAPDPDPDAPPASLPEPDWSRPEASGGPPGGFSLFEGWNRQSFALLLVPAGEPAAVFAALRYGGWNDCPWASVHVARFRRWRSLYGAEPAVLTRDTVEAVVARPPSDVPGAWRLACEQYAHCADIVNQGCYSVERLAAGLRDAPRWFFWWD